MVSRTPLKEKLARLEHEGIVDELRRSNGNVAQAARAAGYPLRTFFTRINTYEINVDDFRQAA